MKRSSYNNGFSLIEVMVALLVLALGILGISKLQGALISSSSDANQRAVAISIAQEKIDDFKSFSKMTPTLSWAAALGSANPENEVAYEHIIGDADITDFDESGGLIQPSSNIQVDPTVYSLAWSVEDYIFINPLTAASEATPTLDSDFKLVNVFVSWVDERGDQQTVSLSTVVDAYNPAVTALSDNSKEGGQLPSVTYTPGLAPEVVNLDVGDIGDNTGLKRETTSPEIMVSQNRQYVEFDYSVVTYNGNNEVIKQEDFRHINCTCQQEAISPGITTFYPTTLKLIFDDQTFDNKFERDSPDFQVPAGSKKWGSRINSGQAGQQSPSCDVCCRDHHDNTGPNNPDKLFDPFRPAGDYTDGDHNHYFPGNDGTLELANDPGDIYVEACTLAKVDGIFRVTQDPLLMTVKTMPESFLLGAGFADYQNYASAYLLQYSKLIDIEDNFPALDIGPVGNDATPSYKYQLNDQASPTLVNLNNEPDLDDPGLAVGDTVNLRSKTIYARYIPTELFTKLKEVVDAGTTWLEVSNLIPFFDPDGTDIAQIGEDTSAWGTNKPAEIDVDQVGLLTALSATTDASGAIATATRPDSVTGFTNTRPIDPNDESLEFITSDEMLVVVSGTAPPSSVNVRITINSSGNSEINPNSVNISGSNGAACSLQNNSGKNIHLCSFAGGTGRVTLSSYNTKQGNSIDNDNEVCLTGATISVINDGTLDEESIINYAGLVAPEPDREIIIVLGSDGCP